MIGQSSEFIKVVSIISGEQDRAEKIRSTLRSTGVDARIGEFSSPVDVLLFDLKSCAPGMIHELCSYAKQVENDQTLIATLGESDSLAGVSFNADIHFSSDAGLSAASLRIGAAKRTSARKAEARLRSQTYSDFGIEFSPQNKSTEFLSVLYLGEASPEFAMLMREFEASGHRMTAAFSSLTALDYAHDENFDAIIVDETATSANPEGFCAILRRSPSLFSTPVLALTQPELSFHSQVVEAASDVLEISSNAASTVNTVEKMVAQNGPDNERFRPCNDVVADTATGLFSSDFFLSHLNRQIDWSNGYKQPLTILSFHLRDLNSSRDKGGDIAFAASIVRSLIRSQDTPTRIDWETIAVSMPGATREEALGAAQRITNVIDSTAFEASELSPQRQILLDYRVTSYVEGQTSTEFLSNAIRPGYKRSGVAA